MAENSTQTKKKRGPGRPFQPGQSGNPGGRPKKAEWLRNEVLKDLPLYYEKLKAIAQGEEKARTKDQIDAIELLLAYGLGRPPQSIELTGQDGGPLRIVLEGDLDKWAQ